MSEFASEWMGRLQPYFGEYGYGIVLVVLFLKGILVVGAFMPAAWALIFAGGLARQGQVSLCLLALAGVVGTIGGDCASYLMGQKLEERLMKSERWGKHIVTVIERLRKEPGIIVFCHFETFLRMFVPIAAGISGIPFRKWFVLNMAGSVFWVATFLSMGYFLSKAGALTAGKTIALVVVGVIIVYVGVRYLQGKRTRRQENDPVGSGQPAV